MIKFSYSITNKKNNRYFTVLFFTGLGLTLWEIALYRKSFIPVSTLLLVTGFIVLVSSIFEFRRFKKTYSYRGIWLYLGLSIHSIMSWGLIGCFCYVASNYYLTDHSDSSTINSRIIRVGDMSGGRSFSAKRTPYFIIDYNGSEKQLVFPSRFLPLKDVFESIELEVTEGYLGHDIILGKKLKLPSDIVLTIDLKIAVIDIESQTALENSFAVLNASNIQDTIHKDSQSDSLKFLIEYEKQYSIEIGADGYDSKSIFFDSRHVPIDEQWYGYSFSELIFELSKSEEVRNHDTVGIIQFNDSILDFDIQRLGN